ncbi:hypothetical protein D3C72_1309900 [compost metagenome]
MAMPRILKMRLPTVTWRTSMDDLVVCSTASTPLPRLAPSTRPSDISAVMAPEAAMAAIRSTMARLE